eukprot:scaffold655_cov225-Pinguiococcus_pyrenoidosus.AAC.7
MTPKGHNEDDGRHDAKNADFSPYSFAKRSTTRAALRAAAIYTLSPGTGPTQVVLWKEPPSTASLTSFHCRIAEMRGPKNFSLTYSRI